MYDFHVQQPYTDKMSQVLTKMVSYYYNTYIAKLPFPTFLVQADQVRYEQCV